MKTHLLHPLLQSLVYSLLMLLPLQGQDLTNAADAALGATALGSNSNYNKDWTPQKAISAGRAPGTIFNPFEGGTIDIRFVMPVDVVAVEVGGLNRYNMKFPSGIEVYVDGEKLAESALPDSPERVRIPVKAHTQTIRLVTTGSHPRRDLGDGKLGPDWGGLGPIQVWTTTDVKAAMAHPEQYQVTRMADAVQSTQAAAGEVEVFVDVRQTEGHPRTFWDKEDIAHFKDMLTRSTLLQEQLAGLKRAMDQRMTEPLNVPEPQKDENGNWKHLLDREVGPIHNKNAQDIANLGIVYALTGEAPYAEFAKKLLLAYAEAFPNYAPGNRPGFNHDQGKLFDQRLSDATWLIPVARGYDLIYNHPSITDAERTKIEEDLLRAASNFIAANSHVLRSPTNWSAICTTAVLITGVVLEDQAMIDLALYGPGGTKENPKGGVMLHFSERSISPDGLWSEGAMGYQGMAMQALVANAEIMRHHGMDFYSHREAAFKKLFDSPIEMAYPDLTAPAVNDSGRASIIGREAYLWEYGYLRYRDPRYLTILDQAGKSISSNFQQFPVSVLYDEISETGTAFEWKSKNFFDVGYGILRKTSEKGIVNVLMDYGETRSHDHPDKLNIDVFAFGDQLIPDPGMVWYEQPLYKNWYSTTVAHNTLVVDELSQRKKDAAQLTFLSGDSIGLQRAHTDQVYAGVIMDRSLFVTPDYIADIFGAFAKLPRTLDLAWHIRGDLETDLPVEPFAFDNPQLGYTELANVRAGSTGDDYQLQFSLENGTARFHAAGGEPTQVILGEGWLKLERPTTILQRRKTNSTLYGNVVELDVDQTAFIKAVAVSGSLDEGYGLLEIETAEGTDYGFASYRPGNYSAGPLKSDALQSFVRMKEGKVVTLAVTGGRVLEVENARIARSEPGNALLEKMDNGAYVLANLSPSPAKIHAVLEGLAQLQSYAIDADGRRIGGNVQRTASEGGQVFDLPANGRIELSAPGTASLYETRQEMLRTVQAEAEAARMKAFNEALARNQVRLAEAEKMPVPANTQLVIQAEDFTGEGGGKVGIASNKKAVIGKAFAGWNNSGHWLEYTVDAPAEGYYNLSVVYCTQLANGERVLEVNGEAVEPFAPMSFEPTGGWANNSDDWKLLTAMNPATEKPLLIKFNKGENVLRMTNSTGVGVNLDYLLVTSPDVEPERLPVD